jgi:hypothetical protein
VLDPAAGAAAAARHTLPLTIGRDLGNDVQLDDPYVCRSTRVVRSGRTARGPGSGSVRPLRAHAGAPSRASPSPPSTRCASTRGSARAPRPAALAPAFDRASPEPEAGRHSCARDLRGALALVSINAYLGSYCARRAQVLSRIRWCCPRAPLEHRWAFVNRVLGLQWNLLSHLAVACGFSRQPLVLADWRPTSGSGVVAPVDGIETALAVPLIAALLSGHLRLCAPTPTFRRNLAALGAAACSSA